jgi:uncharacterized protein (DUF1778 family)
MKNNKKQIKQEGIFDVADRFVTKFFDGLSTGAANQIIKKAEAAKLPPDVIEQMERMRLDAEKFRKLLKKL